MKAKPNSALSWPKLAPSICCISSACARAVASASRSRSHSARKALRAPRCSGSAPMAALHRRHLVAQRVAGQRGQRLLQHALVHRTQGREARACSARSRPSRRPRAAASARTLAPLLPRRPRSSSSCSACWRRRSPRRRVATSAACCIALTAGTAPAVRGCRGSSSRGERRLQRRQPAALQRAASSRRRARPARRAPTARRRARGGMSSVCAAWRTGAAICALHRRGRGQRVGQDVDLVEHDEALQAVTGRGARVQIARSERVTPVSAASTKTDGMRRRQQAQRQLGLGADGIQARRVDAPPARAAAAGAGS